MEKKGRKKKEIALLCVQAWRKDLEGGTIIYFDFTKDALD